MQQPPALQAFDNDASDKEVQLVQQLIMQSWKAYIKALPTKSATVTETITKKAINDTRQ